MFLVLILTFISITVLSTSCKKVDNGDVNSGSYSAKSVSKSRLKSSEEMISQKQSTTMAETSTQAETSTSLGENDNSSEKLVTPKINDETVYHKPLNSSQKVTLVETVFKTYDTVIVDAVVTDFGADLSGTQNSTDAIKSAISYVSSLGGGTVYLPVGKYLVTDTITVPEYVTLRGDWQCPDTEKAVYGTVIVAKPSVLGSSSPKDKPLISLSGHSGIDGLTFYYADQNDISSVKKYGYTIYANNPVTTTIKNVTMINSCYGVGVSLSTQYNELVNIENLYGTFLYNAVCHNATTDVGFYNNINISNGFWLNCDLGVKPTKVQLDSFTRQNLSALILGDLDDQLISNVFISDAKYGFYFTMGIRNDAGFWGVVYNAQLNCETGVFADYLNSRSGVVFTNSTLGKVVNNSPVGAVKVSKTVCDFSGSGICVTENGNADFGNINVYDNVEFNKTTSLYVADGLTSGGAVDNSSKLNEILKSVPNGSVVVIPNGIYRLDSKVSIPDGVEMRSTQGVFSRTNQSQNGKRGVTFVTYASGETFVLGNGSGIRGVRIWHAKNDFKTSKTALDNSTFTNDISVKALGENAYAFLNETVGAYVGFDFTNADNHILKSNYGLSYKNFIVAGGKNGQIIACLSNPNFMTRSNLYEYFVSSKCNVESWALIRASGESNDDFALLRDGIGRTHTKMVKLVNANGEKCLNVFCYGEAGLFDAYNSSAVLVNTSLDYIPNEKFVYEISGGEVTIIGSLRVYGTSIGYNGGMVKACGRIAFGEIKEGVYDSAISTKDEIKYVDDNAKRLSLFDCDDKPSGFNLTLNTNKIYVDSGEASWKFNGTDTKTVGGAFAQTNISEFAKGYLHVKVYASNLNFGDGQIELTSSGTCDSNEINWSFSQAIKNQGWNDVYLALPSSGTTGGEIDLSKLNYLRIYVLNCASSDLYIDSIELVV